MFFSQFSISSIYPLLPFRLPHQSKNLLNFSDSPLVWIHCNGPRLTQVSGNQHFPLSAISRGNGDAFVARVGPVNVFMNPVDSQALGGMKGVDERHLLRWVAGLVNVSAVGKYRSVSLRILAIMTFNYDKQTIKCVYSGFIFLHDSGTEPYSALNKVMSHAPKPTLQLSNKQHLHEWRRSFSIFISSLQTTLPVPFHSFISPFLFIPLFLPFTYSNIGLQQHCKKFEHHSAPISTIFSIS